jgi:dolichyl-phosphate-mannose--protein O-mannosyl transferase
MKYVPNPPQNFWVKERRQIYLIGNPMVWYLSTFAVVAYSIVRGFLILRAKRGYRDFDSSASFLGRAFFVHKFTQLSPFV